MLYFRVELWPKPSQARSIVTEAASGYLIELRVNNVAQLLHTLDQFTFRGRDLDKEAEEFIVGWARELIICLVSANVAGGYLIDNPFRRLVEESFFIPGWVANCRRLNIFLIGCRSPGVVNCTSAFQPQW